MFSKQNNASVNLMLTAAIWLVIGTCMGLILAQAEMMGVYSR